MGYATILFVISIATHIFGTLYLNQRIIDISMSIQEKESEIAVIRNHNSELKKEISASQNKEVIMEMAMVNGMTYDENNVIIVKDSP